MRVATNPYAETEKPLVDATRRFAAGAIRARVAWICKRLEISGPTVSIRNQTSRWGSCSSSGQISLNWRLALLKPALKDYVIYHELAHLREMNHSVNFWNLLKRYDRRARLHDATLNRVSRKYIQVGRI